MKIYTSTACFALLLLLSGCKTSPPVSPAEPVLDYGKIFVVSNVPGAEIHVDNQNTGKLTPDTVTVLTGLRTVSLIKEGYITVSVQVDVVKNQTSEINLDLTELTVQKMVLLEDFANVSCIPCVAANIITHSLSGFYGSKLHIVKFPTNFPKPTDPFYLNAKADCDARMSYYNIITAPTIIIDGITKPLSSDSIQIKNAIEAALLEVPEFDITVHDTIIGGIIHITASVIPVNTAGLNIGDYSLYTAVVEKRIEFTTPPGSNGETVFYDVLRKMLPASSGGDLQPDNITETVEYNYQTALGASWNASEITTIVYLQNKNTRKVIQAASAK